MHDVHVVADMHYRQEAEHGRQPKPACKVRCDLYDVLKFNVEIGVIDAHMHNGFVTQIHL